MRQPLFIRLFFTATGSVFPHRAYSPSLSSDGSLSFTAFFLNMKLRNRRIFIARKKTTRMIKVSIGLVGAILARSIIGKPKTMAGKF